MAILERAFDQRFRPHWLSYVFQSVLAAGSVFVALIALRQQNLVVAASLGVGARVVVGGSVVVGPSTGVVARDGAVEPTTD